MPQFVISVAAVIAFLCTGVYLHAVFRLHGLIAAEKPEWVNLRGALDFLYTGFPRVANPNVGAEVVKVALSARARQLTAPAAARFVRRIRVCLPLGLVGYLVGTSNNVIFHYMTPDRTTVKSFARPNEAPSMLF